MSDDPEKERWNVAARHIKTIAEDMLKEHFGERCDEYCEGCPNCERWAALDALIKNPYMS